MPAADQEGFTIVELLCVLVLMSILASVALTSLSEGRERAFIAAMKADLNHLRLAQVMYYQGHSDTYADDVASLVAEEVFTATDGVSVLIHSANDSTWNASTTHAGTTVTCAFDASSGGIHCSNEQEPERTIDLPGTRSIAF